MPSHVVVHLDLWVRVDLSCGLHGSPGNIGAGEQVHVAVGRLEGAPALVVLDRGHPVGVITRSDVLATLAAGPR